jgi:hypothetical protein
MIVSWARNPGFCRDGGGDAAGDNNHAGPTADRPGGTLVDIDAGPGVRDWCRLGLAVWLRKAMWMADPSKNRATHGP